MPEKDLYKVLNVGRDASEDELRRSYRKLAREYHPDVNPDDPASEERFKEVGFAYEVLSDAEKRRTYDEFGHDGLAKGFDSEQARAYKQWSSGSGGSPFGRSGDFHFEDLFEGLFGGRPAGPRRGRDLEASVSVDFLDAVMGREIRVDLQQRPTLRVRVPAGSEDGARIRLAGKGEVSGSGGPPGNLFLKLHVRSHPFFTRDEADLFVDLPVSLPELVQGTDVEVPTPDGNISMKIPPRSANGRKLRVRGKGGYARGGTNRGDLYVRLVLELPDPPEDDKRLEEIADQIAPLYEGTNLRKDFS